jgi:guanylate kinase
MAGILFIISAPSGSGKSTLVTEVRRLVAGLDFSVSYTTRERRGSEENGREYHFISREEFVAKIEAGQFLEWAEVFGKYYGTATTALDHAREQGKDLLLDIDVQGALQVMEKMPNAVSIFFVPPSPEILELRLRNRSRAEGVTHEDVIERRLSQARQELRYIDRYQYALVNDALDVAAAEMRAVVLTERGVASTEEQALARRCLTRNRSEALKSALESFDIELASVG